MGIALGSTVVNVADLDAMTAFWTAALGLEASGDDPDFRVLRGGATNLSLQRARTPVTARDQMHLDLYSDDVPVEVERLLALGAGWVRESREDPEDRYVVLVDPEGNEFCVCEVASP
jgi:catechol 2,3-dioxygenase-like lactoylglutathione lyase family enzyme